MPLRKKDQCVEEGFVGNSRLLEVPELGVGHSDEGVLREVACRRLVVLMLAGRALVVLRVVAAVAVVVAVAVVAFKDILELESRQGVFRHSSDHGLVKLFL